MESGGGRARWTGSGPPDTDWDTSEGAWRPEPQPLSSAASRVPVPLGGAEVFLPHRSARLMRPSTASEAYSPSRSARRRSALLADYQRRGQVISAVTVYKLTVPESLPLGRHTGKPVLTTSTSRLTEINTVVI